MDREAYVERVRELLPGLRERARECEDLRRIPDATVKAFDEAGLMRVVQPARWSGYELSPMALYEGAALVATACPSSAWFLSVVGVHNWQLALFPDAAQEDVWGEDTGVRISSSYAPTGRVEVLDEGFRLSGRWSFSSGCDHCDWVFLGGLVRREGQPAEMRTFLLPRSDYAIDDTWFVAGLSGTGSKDIVVDGAFVPEHRTHSFVDAYNLDSPGQATNSGPLYRLPFGCVFVFGISAPAIGAAQGAFDAYRTSMREKRMAGGAVKLADDPFAQRRLSEAAGEISAARSALEGTFETLCALAEAGESIPLELRTRARFNSANIVERCVRSVNILFEASGGRAIFLDSPIQRFFRDVHAMRAHAANNPDRAAQIFGFSELNPGEPPMDLFL